MDGVVFDPTLRPILMGHGSAGSLNKFQSSKNMFFKMSVNASRVELRTYQEVITNLYFKLL